MFWKRSLAGLSVFPMQNENCSVIFLKQTCNFSHFEQKTLSFPSPHLHPHPHPYTHELDAFGFSVSLSLIPRGGGGDILVLHTVLSTDELSCSNPESVLVYWLSTREVNMITHIYEADIKRFYFSGNRVNHFQYVFLSLLFEYSFCLVWPFDSLF